ncbi:unnamed protein product, partial [Laminaria digitata]
RIAAVVVIFSLADVKLASRTAFCEAFVVGVPRAAVVQHVASMNSHHHEKGQQQQQQQQQCKYTKYTRSNPAALAVMAPRARGVTRASALTASGQGDDAAAASTAGDSQRPPRVGGEAEGVSKAGLRALRRQIDDRAPASETIGTLVNDVIVGGQEMLTTEASVILQRCPRLTEAAETGELLAGLSASTRTGAEAEFLLQNLDKEVVAELHTPWAKSVKKWRQKALAVEKYRSTNPTANAAVYTYMTNCCLREGMWEVAYDGEIICC